MATNNIEVEQDNAVIGQLNWDGATAKILTDGTHSWFVKSLFAATSKSLNDRTRAADAADAADAMGRQVHRKDDAPDAFSRYEGEWRRRSKEEKEIQEKENEVKWSEFGAGFGATLGGYASLAMHPDDAGKFWAAIVVCGTFGYSAPQLCNSSFMRGSVVAGCVVIGTSMIGFAVAAASKK